MIIAQWRCALPAVLHIVLSAATSGNITVRFKNRDGAAIGERDCNMSSTLFRVSRRLGKAIQGTLYSQIELSNDPEMFDVAARLFDEKSLDIKLDARKIADVLYLVKDLDIPDCDEKKAFYRGLARIATDEEAFAEMEKHTPDTRTYMLQLLKKYASVHGLDVRARGGVEKPCLDMCTKDAENQARYGLIDKTEAASTLRILENTMNKVGLLESDVFYALVWFVEAMDIRSLDMSRCRLKYFNVVKCIGDMKSLTALNLHCCSMYPGSLPYILRGLESLEKLDVSDVSLGKDDIAGIAKTQGLTNLALGGCKIEPGSLRHIQDLVNLEELNVSRIHLDEDDMAVIGNMKSLKKLDLSDCNINPGKVKHLRGLVNLTQILGLRGRFLSGEEMSAIGNMRSLAELDISGCKVESGSFGHLVSLTDLKHFSVYGIKGLGQEDWGVVDKLRSRGVHVQDVAQSWV